VAVSGWRRGVTFIYAAHTFSSTSRSKDNNYSFRMLSITTSVLLRPLRLRMHMRRRCPHEVDYAHLAIARIRLARIRLGACVRALVPLEGARLSGSVLAARLVARVRTLAAVRALVQLEVAWYSGQLSWRPASRGRRLRRFPRRAAYTPDSPAFP